MFRYVTGLGTFPFGTQLSQFRESVGIGRGVPTENPCLEVGNAAIVIPISCLAKGVLLTNWHIRGRRQPFVSPVEGITV